MRKLAGGTLGLICLLFAVTASAYVGPGAGLSAIGTVLALIVAVIVAILGFFWYPIKRLMNRNKEPSLDEAVDSAVEQSAEKSAQDPAEK